MAKDMRCKLFFFSPTQIYSFFVRPRLFFFLILSLLFFSLAFSQASIAPADSKAQEVSNPPKNYVLILCFHDISTRGRYGIDKADLKKIFSLLQSNFTVLSLRDWHADYQNKTSFAKPPVVLTFDDGYPSLFQEVVPLLKEYNYGASFFIYTNLYHDNSAFYKNLMGLDSRWEVGGHSASHVDMLQLLPLDRQTKFYTELFLSRKKLEFLTTKDVTSLAWPFGVYNPDLVELAKKAGYILQVSTDGVVASVKEDMILFPRITVQQPQPVEQVKKLLQNYQKLF